MSLFTNLVKHKAIPPSSTTAQGSITVCARSIKGDGPKKHSKRWEPSSRYPGSSDSASRPSYRCIEDTFVQSLVEASLCRRHQRFESSTRRACGVYAPRNLNRTLSVEQRRRFSSKPVKQYVPEVAEIQRKEYEDLANTYPGFGQPLKERKTKHDRRHISYFPLAPRLIMTPDQEKLSDGGSRVILEPEDDDHRRRIKEFKNTLGKNLGWISQAKLWRKWESLRTPRPRYLDDKTIDRLFRHLTWVEHKHAPEAMQRFLAVLNECEEERLSLEPDVWNSAISFVGRAIRKASDQEVRNALEMWKRMENSDVRATTATFNILFDVAVRAGRFALADTLFSELKNRQMTPDRYSRAGLIFYAGIRMDGDDVRKTYQEFVNANEVVDTAIINTVIVSLLKAGEAPAAESVFYKMKHLHERKFGTVAPVSWQEKRRLGVVLKNAGTHLRHQQREHESSFFGAAFSLDERKEALQRVSPIGPDAATYRILIQHHAYTSADLERVRELLSEMKQRNLHVHGSVYYHVFRGYRKHGGFAYSAWTLRSLEEVWSEVLAAMSITDPEPALQNADETASNVKQDSPPHRPIIVDSEDVEERVESELERKPYFSTALAFAVIQAFYRCGGRFRMLEVYKEILFQWKDITDEERDRVQDMVDECV